MNSTGGNGNDVTFEPPPPEMPIHTCYIYTIVTAGVCQGTLYVIAAVGNVLCFLTWYRLGRKKGFNSSTLLILALAVADLFTQMPLIIIYIVPNLLRFSGHFHDPFLIATEPYALKYGWPIASLGNFGTVMFTTLVTIHRYCVLSKPFSSFTRRLTSTPATLIQIAAIVVAAMAYQVPRLFAFNIVDFPLPDGRTIEVAMPSSLGRRQDYQLWYYTISYIFLIILLPLVVSSVFTILILALLASARRNRKSMTNQTSNTANTANNNSERGITVMLLTVVILFIVCQLPNTVIRVYMAFRPDSLVWCGSVIFYANAVAIFCVSFNSSVNIFIYARSKEFRTVLRGMCCCGAAAGRGSDTALSLRTNSSAADTGSKTNISIVATAI